MASKTARLDLVSEVIQTLYGTTSTFEVQHVGADLVYLVEALADEGKVEFGNRNRETITLLKLGFPPEHAVWKHVTLDPDFREVEPPLPMVREKAKSRNLVCPKCGSDSFECEGDAHCSMVSVDANLDRDGSVQTNFDWMDAGAADFEPGEITCSDCGQSVVEPDEDEIGVYEGEADEDDEEDDE